MSFPADGMEATYKNNIDEVCAFLDARHKDHYAVFNLSTRQYNIAKYALRTEVLTRNSVLCCGLFRAVAAPPPLASHNCLSDSTTELSTRVGRREVHRR